jgi:hypothetical protein
MDMKIENIIKEYERVIISLPNVTSIGIGEKNGKESILVYVTKKIPESQLDKSAIIPKIIEGIETDVIHDRRKLNRTEEFADEALNPNQTLSAEILAKLQLYFVAAN